jgi:hypothetical protein
MVSGYGDGALVDLCRLTIERFRQDRIVYDLFGADLETIEAQLLDAMSKYSDANLYNLFSSIEQKILGYALEHLRTRIRKDTRVLLNLAGRDGKNKEVRDAFGESSSVLNRLLLYMLFRCGAFAPNFEPFDVACRRVGSSSLLICRHGAQTRNHVDEIFVDKGNIANRLMELQENPSQKPIREWKPGSFPI